MKIKYLLKYINLFRQNQEQNRKISEFFSKINKKVKIQCILFIMSSLFTGVFMGIPGVLEKSMQDVGSAPTREVLKWRIAMVGA